MLLARLRELGKALSTDEIAVEIGLHPNTVRAHLEVLLRSGKVERSIERRGTRGRPRDLFAATGAPEAEHSYAQLAAVLAAQLESLGTDPASQAVEAGKRWAAWELGVPDVPEEPGPPSVPPSGVPPSGTSLPRTPPSSAHDEVVAILRRTGFAPEVSEDGARILLHHCPFREIAGQHTAVVCGTHLGLVQGTLDRVAPGAEAHLVPFVAPGLCEARLTLSEPGPLV